MNILHIAIESRNSGVLDFQQYAKDDLFGNTKEHGQGPLNLHQ